MKTVSEASRYPFASRAKPMKVPRLPGREGSCARPVSGAEERPEPAVSQAPEHSPERAWSSCGGSPASDVLDRLQSGVHLLG